MTITLEGFTSKTGPIVRRVAEGLFLNKTPVVSNVTVESSLNPNQGAINRFVFTVGNSLVALIPVGVGEWKLEPICHKCQGGSRWNRTKLECGGCGETLSQSDRLSYCFFTDSNLPDFYDLLQDFVYENLPSKNVLEVALEAEVFASMIRNAIVVSVDFSGWAENDRWQQLVS